MHNVSAITSYLGVGLLQGKNKEGWPSVGCRGAFWKHGIWRRI